MIFQLQQVFALLFAILPTAFLQEEYPLHLGIRDLTTGSGIPNITCELYRGHSKTNHWYWIASMTTNNRGLAGNTITPEQFSLGEYRVLFYAKPYYESKNLTTFYPYVEVHFKHTNPNEYVIVPVLSSPHGYSVYKGNIA